MASEPWLEIKVVKKSILLNISIYGKLLYKYKFSLFFYNLLHFCWFSFDLHVNLPSCQIYYHLLNTVLTPVENVLTFILAVLIIIIIIIIFYVDIFLIKMDLYFQYCLFVIYIVFLIYFELQSKCIILFLIIFDTA